MILHGERDREKERSAFAFNDANGDDAATSSLALISDSDDSECARAAGGVDAALLFDEVSDASSDQDDHNSGPADEDYRNNSSGDEDRETAYYQHNAGRDRGRRRRSSRSERPGTTGRSRRHKFVPDILLIRLALKTISNILRILPPNAAFLLQISQFLKNAAIGQNEQAHHHGISLRKIAEKDDVVKFYYEMIIMK
jgi:hypothetical protein